MSKAKICFLTFRNIFDTPCLPRYQKILGNNFDIIYFDRKGIREECGAKEHYRFEYLIDNNNDSTKKRIVGYSKFRKFAKKIIKKNQYEKLIVLPTQTAWYFADILLFKYRGQFVLDIRDYASENNKMIYFLDKLLINASRLTSITSPTFTNFLPKGDYAISHNYQAVDKSLIEQYRSRTANKESAISISFIGSIRFLEQLKKFILIFANDKRFILKFIGSGSEDLKEFCDKNAVRNVKLVGHFNREELPNFYMETDIAMNVYGNNNPYLDNALSNKLYSAAMMGMPILVSPRTAMEEVSVKYGFGFAVDLDDTTIADKVFEYYHSIDWSNLRAGCDRFMDDIMKDEEIYLNRLNSFFDLEKE